MNRAGRPHPVDGAGSRRSVTCGWTYSSAASVSCAFSLELTTLVIHNALFLFHSPQSAVTDDSCNLQFTEIHNVYNVELLN